MARAFNARTRLTRSLFKPNFSQIAEGVWLVQGGFPQKTMNVYLIEDERRRDRLRRRHQGDDERASPAARRRSGGIKRVVLGHGHADHRGAAPGLGAPVFCHPDEVADAEGDGGEHYFDFSKLERWYARPFMPRCCGCWDGGPVKIEGTVKEGDEIAGFKVVHLPGHAPGLIGLWRESDRLALVSDTLLHARPADRAQGRAARAAPGVQPGHRAGAREHPQAGGDGAGGCLARPRGPGHRRRARRSWSGRRRG